MSEFKEYSESEIAKIKDNAEEEGYERGYEVAKQEFDLGNKITGIPANTSAYMNMRQQAQMQCKKVSDFAIDFLIKHFG